MSKYDTLLKERSKIIYDSVGIDYSKYELDGMAFDYEKMMSECSFTVQEMKKIQGDMGIGNTPLIKLNNITNLIRKSSKKGYGATIYLKDEATNLSGSFKVRRASLSVYEAKRRGYKGVIAATSGNYGAAVAAAACKLGLKCIIVQECYDSKLIGQPEILEKARKCEAYGAEVIQLTVGPELFYTFLNIIKETGFFNASLYTPFGISGVETLGIECVEQMKQITGKEPDAIICTNAGGGNLTGTARGVKIAGAKSKIIASSVDLQGLHMASDNDFNKKSFTTGHTGFGMPFATNPDRSDVPRSAARPLRYMDRYVITTQGEVFYTTEMLAQLEGLERGPAGNTSLAAAISIAKEMKEDQTIIVQETEYTSAGKHINAQLSFAKNNGIKILIGDPKEQIPGQNIIFPTSFNLIKCKDLELDNIRKSYLKNAFKVYNTSCDKLSKIEIDYLTEELNVNKSKLKELLEDM